MTNKLFEYLQIIQAHSIKKWVLFLFSWITKAIHKRVMRKLQKLKMALGENAKFGSVDKFQGLEPPIIFFSLYSSDADESACGMDFLFDKHRINVAISRAQCLAIVVGNPALMSTRIGNVEQMTK